MVIEDIDVTDIKSASIPIDDDFERKKIGQTIDTWHANELNREAGSDKNKDNEKDGQEIQVDASKDLDKEKKNEDKDKQKAGQEIQVDADKDVNKEKFKDPKEAERDKGKNKGKKDDSLVNTDNKENTGKKRKRTTKGKKGGFRPRKKKGDTNSFVNIPLIGSHFFSV
jgi:hypothetical protein